MYELEHTPQPDKNLINTVKDLEKEPVTSQQAQQMGQKKKDLRKDMIRSDEKYQENEHSYQ
ncbi:hypothetical protein H1230_17925 [Paenibacillus sp. 19GGS1-52]|nr:hypothetical protein H1230_17925 [Paenibacillus sp. 19GGS1-52]